MLFTFGSTQITAETFPSSVPFRAARFLKTGILILTCTSLMLGPQSATRDSGSLVGWQVFNLVLQFFALEPRTAFYDCL